MRIWPLAFLRRHRARQAELDARTRAAGREQDVSRERLETVRKDVVNPLRELGRQNRFAEMIRDSLLEGHEH